MNVFLYVFGPAYRGAVDLLTREELYWPGPGNLDIYLAIRSAVLFRQEYPLLCYLLFSNILFLSYIAGPGVF